MARTREYAEAARAAGDNVTMVEPTPGGHRSHLDRRFWISVDLDADVPADEVARLAEASYELVCAGLTRKQQAELAGLSA